MVLSKAIMAGIMVIPKKYGIPIIAVSPIQKVKNFNMHLQVTCYVSIAKKTHFYISAG